MSGKQSIDDYEYASTSSAASDTYSPPTSQLLENVLPENVLKLFKAERNISQLYDWQLKCLSNQALLGGKNFILSLPTGAGKTLIAEVFMLRELLIRNRNCLLILPFVAIVQEKISSLLPFEVAFGICLEEYAASKGRIPPFKRRKANSLYVCTIEKANILVNSLIECGRMEKIGLVIVDELHMLGDGSRGGVLEQCLVKIRLSTQCQIIGISATLGNVEDLKRFLKAELFTTDFRPVKLSQYVKIASSLYKIDESGEILGKKELPKVSNNLLKKDVDGIVQLLEPVVPQRSVIIFCPTKKNCENLCLSIASMFPSSIVEYRSAERRAIVEQMKEENDGRICPVLERGILSGITYHHSGLTQDERQHVEAAFKNGVICIICATSTLAAGVNLPARRVIVRSPYIGRNPIGKAHYLQMVGRAGRAGFDDKGDSIVILHEGMEKQTFFRMIQNPIEDCRSALEDDSTLEAFCLDLIVLKLCKEEADFCKVIEEYTLLGVQKPTNHVAERISAVVEALHSKKMIVKNESGELTVTNIGSATFGANLNPSAALDLNAELMENLQQGVVLSSHLHLLYAVIPPNVQAPSIDWDIFYNEYRSLTESERNLVASLGIRERNIIHYLATCCSGKSKSERKPMQLYVAFMMRQIWNQRSMWEVSQYFGVERGWLQSTLQATCIQAGAIVRFSEKIPSLWSLKSLLPDIVKMLSMCKSQELIPLLDIDCVKWNRAKALFTAGFRTVGAIAKADASKLVLALDGKLSASQARRMINSAKTIVRDQIAEKVEELESIGVVAPDGFPAI